MVEHSLGKGEVISSILIIGSRVLKLYIVRRRCDKRDDGPCLIVKWVGIGTLLLYLASLVVAIWQFRGKLSRLRFGLFAPLVVGNFVGLSLPWIFEEAVVTRICFVVAHVAYLYCLAILVKAMVHQDGVLLRADS